MDDAQISIYPSTKAYTRADGSVVRHVSDKKYVKKLPVCTDDDCRIIAARQDAGERLSVIAAEYNMTYNRTWGIMKRWRDARVGILPMITVAPTIAPTIIVSAPTPVLVPDPSPEQIASIVLQQDEHDMEPELDAESRSEDV